MAKKLTDKQWENIFRRNIVDNIGCTELSKEYGVPESTIRSRVKVARLGRIKPVANQIVEVSNDLKSMDNFARAITLELARKNGAMDEMLMEIAESELKNGRKLSAIKSAVILNLDIKNLSRDDVAMVKVLGETVNNSIDPALKLKAINSHNPQTEDTEITIIGGLPIIEHLPENGGVSISAPAGF